MSKSQRNKGKAYERTIARQLRVLYPGAWRNPDQVTDAQGQDLIDTGPLLVQCKAWQKYPPIGAIYEVTDRARQLGMVPTLIAKGDHRPSMVVLPLDDFIELLSNQPKKENEK